MSSGVPTAYPNAPSTTTQGGVYTVPPPPVGYPTTDPSPNPPTAPVHTNSRGDGFWKGCCAALCCCCVLDACF